MSDFRLEHRDGVARLTFDRPDRRNAMSFEMTRAFIASLEELARDNSARVVVIGGAGTDFSAGADMGDMASAMEADALARAERFSEGVRSLSQPLVKALLGLPQPVVSSVRGHAIGVAVQIALASDLVIASETAKFTLPQVRLGHTLDHGESMLLPRRVGQGRALQMALIGDRLSAHDAERFGMVNWVVADDVLDAETDALVERLRLSAPISLRETKALLRAIPEAEVDASMAREYAAIRRCAASEDFVEAMAAFAERRPPRFEGR